MEYNSQVSVIPIVFLKHGLPSEISELLASRTNMALAKNTKGNYETVKVNIQRCEVELDCDLDFPLTNISFHCLSFVH